MIKHVCFIRPPLGDGVGSRWQTYVPPKTACAIHEVVKNPMSLVRVS